MPLFHNRLAAGVVGFGDVNTQVEQAFAVGDGHDDAACCATVLHPILDYRRCHINDALAAAVEGLAGCSVDAVGFLFVAHVAKLLLGEGKFDSEHTHNLHRQILIVGGLVVVNNQVLDEVVGHVGDIDAYTFAQQSVVTTVIDVCALLVHNVVILKQALTDAEVVFFNTFLSVFDSLGNHAALNHLALFQAESVEHLHHTVGSEQTHQLVLKRHVEH